MPKLSRDTVGNDILMQNFDNFALCYIKNVTKDIEELSKKIKDEIKHFIEKVKKGERVSVEVHQHDGITVVLSDTRKYDKLLL